MNVEKSGDFFKRYLWGHPASKQGTIADNLERLSHCDVERLRNETSDRIAKSDTVFLGKKNTHLRQM